MDNTSLTLRQVAARCCKRVDVGTAVLPKPLFQADAAVDNSGAEQETIPGATIAIVKDEHMPNSTSSEPRYAQILRKEFNSIVVEHHLKWTPLCHTQPGPIDEEHPSARIGRYDFHHADHIVDWALKQKMKVKGHVLVWHVTSPPFLEDMSPDRVKEEMRRHIFTTMGHFRGRIHTWDVVNESLAPDGTLAENIFLRKLGPSYIDMAFRWAQEADPTATLIYNDNKVEGMGRASNAKKADGFYELLKGMVERGVPVHGCGMQAHFNAGGVGRQRPPTPYQVKCQIRRLGELGLKVNISEMDVRARKLPQEKRVLAQHQIYHDILAAALSEPAFDGVWLWGFTDRHTWVKHFYSDDEPLIFDKEYVRKDSYYALQKALATITPGGLVGGGTLHDADVDANGNKWGHEWMLSEPVKADTAEGESGDSRPDWLQNT